MTFLEMWQGSQNLCATQKESHPQNKQMTAIGYISDTEDIVTAPWSLFHHNGAAAFKLLEWSPFPPALSAKDLHAGWTQILHDHQFRRINHHPVKSDEETTPESISDTKNCLNWNGNLDDPNHCEDNCLADIQSNVVPENGIEVRESLEKRDVSAALIVPRLIRPTPKSKRQAEMVLLTVNAMETGRNMVIK